MAATNDPVIRREIVKFRKVSGSLIITIPRELAKLADLNEGDRLMVTLRDNNQIVVEKEPG